MAKGSGSTRVSKWINPKNELEPLYYRNGYRVEYSQLHSEGQKAVKEEKKAVSKELFKKLGNTKTKQVIDNNKEIIIGYTSKGLDHFANDAMLNLSGKYFSKQSMLKIDKIIEKSVYMPTNHELTHPRKDGRDLWFSYKDSDGRGVFFKVCWNKNIKMYELYSVVDK